MTRSSLLERWDADDRSYLALRIKRRLIPAIMGGVIADAIGVPVEFMGRGGFNITGITGYGTYNQPPGTWSDDTTMTFCLMENLMEEQDLEGLMRKFADWRDHGYMTPHGHMFDIGRTTEQSVDRFLSGFSADQWGGGLESDNGNGALMRISPLVFLLFKEFNFDNRLKLVEEIAHVTHRHPRSTLGCVFYVEFLLGLFNNNKPLKAYKQAAEICLNYLKGTKYEKEFPAYERVLNLSIPDLSKDEIVSDGYVVHSLEAALWSFLKHDNYRDIVLEAVNLGGDTDTIGLIAGTMAGMCYHKEGLPEEWLNEIVKKDELLEICKRYFDFCTEKAIAKVEAEGGF
ncbi:ADP-ribosylglycohydrolase family protein [Priestia koreensis]|uniref:ADP-ribosylglycohydrolase family protein n=1 Tax=Priestia koreensis TaxID=284581 RepID=UPI00345ABF4A